MAEGDGSVALRAVRSALRAPRPPRYRAADMQRPQPAPRGDAPGRYARTFGGNPMSSVACPEPERSPTQPTVEAEGALNGNGFLRMTYARGHMATTAARPWM